MKPDDHVCLCFRVSLRKLTHFVEREEPSVPSQLSECLGAGTGCGWCVPQLERLHTQWTAGESMAIPGDPGERVLERTRWRQAQREARQQAAAESMQTPDETAPPSA